MAKYPTYPTLFDEVLQISISKLKEWGYLKPHQIISGTIRWSINEKETANISIRVDTYGNYIKLDYSCNKEPVNYKIIQRAESIPAYEVERILLPKRYR